MHTYAVTYTSERGIPTCHATIQALSLSDAADKADQVAIINGEYAGNIEVLS